MSKRNGAAKTPAQIRAEAKAKKEAAKELEEANKALADAEAAGDSGEDDDNDANLLEDLEPSKLERIIAECGGEGSFIVSMIAANGQDAKLGQYDIDCWPASLEALAVQKGGGTFKIVFRNDKGHYVNQTTRTFDSDTYGALKTQIPAPVVGNDNAAIMTMFQAMQTQMINTQLEASKRSETMMLEMMKIQSSAGSGGLPLKDIIMLAQGDKKSGMAEIRELLETMRFLRDDGGLEPENPWIAALTRGMAMLKPFLEAGAARLANPDGTPGALGTVSPLLPGQPGYVLPATAGPGTALPVPSKVPAASTATAPASSLPPAPIPENVQAATYGAYGSMLFEAAQKNSEPGASARFVLDNIGILIEAENLKIIAVDPYVVDRVIQHNPPIAQYRQWIVDFFAEAAEGVDALISDLKGEKPPVEVAAEIVEKPETKTDLPPVEKTPEVAVA